MWSGGYSEYKITLRRSASINWMIYGSSHVCKALYTGDLFILFISFSRLNRAQEVSALTCMI